VSRQGPTVMNRWNAASRTVSVNIVTVLFKLNDTYLSTSVNITIQQPLRIYSSLT
jgi:hypothetical protein